VRLIGTTLYLEDPSLKRLDGGRPWVEKRGETLHGALGDQLGGGFQTDPSSGFGGLVKIVQGARAIRELGPATVDGQPTTGFRLSVDLLAREKKLSARRRRALRKAVHPLATVELFIAENGLPVRSRITVRLRHAQGEVILQLDIPVIEIPVSVQPPPPAETISEAKLDRLLARLQAHRHRRHAHRRRS